ncbi:unnamed protein product [Vitrella brassicaformis CCMP3155]|uniref:Ion transport domain-containing protein n=1 Tax=Vitrella brassicaformis (strain CCMP3155) TaxID=1169540 RepID=A0A0G4GTX1_VITBC|nr:unnamed protein product [Vitrella brassicaformis CCMP3155]|eukprot:CEM34063.1 unnamed protein product [Vitrella brassicaformis CCMP3155]
MPIAAKAIPRPPTLLHGQTDDPRRADVYPAESDSGSSEDLVHLREADRQTKPPPIEQAESLDDVKGELPPALRTIIYSPRQMVHRSAVLTTNDFRDSIKEAIDKGDAEGLENMFMGMKPEHVEITLKSGDWCGHHSAIHYAAGTCRDAEVFETLLQDRRHLLSVKDARGRTPLHVVAEKDELYLVEKFVDWGGSDLLKYQDENGYTALHYAADEGHADVVEWILKLYPQLLKTKNNDGETAFDRALIAAGMVGVVFFSAKVLTVMVGVAGHMVIELLETSSEQLDQLLKPQLMQSRQQDSLSDDLSKLAEWLEAFAAGFCTDTSENDFRESLAGKGKEWLTLLEAAEPLQVVTQANSISFVTYHWQETYKNGSANISPRDVFISRVLSMLMMVTFVLLHIEELKGNDDAKFSCMGQSVWLWSTVMTGIGFILQEISQCIRLGTSYWADSWNYIDSVSSLTIIAFIITHFTGWSDAMKVKAGVLIALLFALRILQTASLHPTVGPQILAVLRMLSDISMFLLLYLYILLVFAAILLFSYNEDHEFFGTYGQATLNFFYVGFGDFDNALNNAIESQDTLGTVLLLIYAVLSSIILLNLLIAIMASTYSAIEATQNAQYQLLRIRVLNEYLTVSQHERHAPPFNLIAVVISVPLRYVSSLMSEQRRQQSTLWRMVFWSSKAVYSTVDAILFAIAFIPAAIYRGLEDFLQAMRRGHYLEALSVVLYPLAPLSILYDSLRGFCTSQESDDTIDGTSRRQSVPLPRSQTSFPKLPSLLLSYERSATRTRREARKTFNGNIHRWIEAADHHNLSFPDVIAALNQLKDQIQKNESVLQDISKRQIRMEERLALSIESGRLGRHLYRRHTTDSHQPMCTRKVHSAQCSSCMSSTAYARSPSTYSANHS